MDNPVLTSAYLGNKRVVKAVQLLFAESVGAKEPRLQDLAKMIHSLPGGKDQFISAVKLRKDDMALLKDCLDQLELRGLLGKSAIVDQMEHIATATITIQINRFELPTIIKQWLQMSLAKGNLERTEPKIEIHMG